MTHSYKAMTLPRPHVQHKYSASFCHKFALLEPFYLTKLLKLD